VGAEGTALLRGMKRPEITAAGGRSLAGRADLLL